MSRSSDSQQNTGSLKALMHSMLFRRMVSTWAVLSALLLFAVAFALIMVINGIYISSESELLLHNASLIADVRELFLKDELDKEEAVTLQAKITGSEGCSCYIYHPDGLIVTLQESQFTRVDESDPVAAALAQYADKLFSGNEVDPHIIRVGRTEYMMACLLVEHDADHGEAIVCISTVAGIRHRQHMLYAAFGLAIALVILIGIFVIFRLTRIYVLPYTEIAHAAIEMSHGNLNARVQREDEKGEVGLLARTFNRLGASLSLNFVQLERERSRLVQIVNSSSNGIAVTDASGELIQYNPALLELFSQLRMDSKSDISHDRRLMVIPDDTIWEHFNSVNSTGLGERIVYPIDKERVLWINITPVISAEGEQVGVVGNFQDMTELERLERTRREYVANVSHELRRPLTALQGLLEPIRDGLVTDEADKQRYYDIMLHEIERLSRLISDMMQLSRLQSDDIKLQIEPLDISEITADLAESYRGDVEGRGTAFEIETGGELVALADADRVEQVLVILIDNAIKFTPYDGKISLRTFINSAGEVCVEVRDSGCGISQDDLPHVFERFYKADKSHASEGTGLGLSIARNIIQKMDGRIWCTSELGKGTSMTFALKPYDPENDAEEAF